MMFAAAPQQRSTRDVSIPYRTSMIVISTVAMLAPLSIFVLSILFTLLEHNNNKDFHDMDDGMRYLQQKCINATATDDPTLGTTWDATKLTAIIASSVAVLCAIGYELFRRDPIVGKYVYDRKRLKEPDRTPPPLMLSRSLWTGYDDDDQAGNCGGTGGKKEMTRCWKVKPAILELLFINLDHKYVRYSKAADDARKKREERGQYTCCRTDEDGYEYFPGHDYTLDEEVIAKRFEGEWKKTINDLFPAESTGGSFDSKREIEESVDNCLEQQDNTDVDPESLAPFDESENEVKAGEGVDNDIRPAKCTGGSFDPKREIEESVDNCLDQQDNNGVDPESLALIDGSENKVKAEEGLDTNCKSGGDESLNDDESGKKLAYPYRLVYLFMPPGFHVWQNALPYISHFFCLPAIVRRFNILFGRASNDDDDSNDDISLTEPEKELLYFVGLDIYLLIRFARLGFDVTYYPFLVACVAVLPVYYSAAKGSSGNNYLSNTINSIENGSKLIWVVLVFSVAFFLYVLRRLWIEWEIFIQLRHDFLARGTLHFHNNSIKQKYQKTCIVECVPDECRTDDALFNEFNKLFPNQIESAEMLAETSKLEALVNMRKKLIARIENMDSLYRYKCWKNMITKPDEPKIRTGKLCFGEKQDLKAYYENKLLELDRMIDTEYTAIVKKRARSCTEDEVKCQQEGHSDPGLFDTLYRLFPSHLRTLIQSPKPFSSSCGIVEFKNFAAKQWAVQCNLADEPYWMVTTDAPDPRDIIWSNMAMDYKTIEYRESISEFVLLIGLACWGVVVTWITSLSNVIATGVGLPQVGYLQSLAVFLVLLWLPAIFFWFADRVIRYKSLSQIDDFVMKWSTGYRIANIFFVFFNINLIHTVRCFNESPQTIWLELSNGIVRQSTLLINLVIQAAGLETMLQLLQWRSLIKQAVIRPLIDVNSKSKRCLDSLKEAPYYERSFVFGFYAPTLSYCLMIGMMFGFICPLMLGVCAIYFWIATKIFTHNALFVYRQPYESGGMRFYYWSRVAFITCYCSVVIFAGMLAFKSFANLAICFLLVMIFIVYLVDKAITRTFVIHSLDLPIKLVAEEEVAWISESKISTHDEEASFMYRNPILNQKTWQ